MITLDTIQNNLREAIRLSNKSQKEIANTIGIKPSQISKYMNQNKFPSLETFANLCLAIDASANYILGLEDEHGARIQK